MADVYATEFVGGPDGTQNPPKKLDSRLVGAKKRTIRASKPATALAAADRLYIGKVPAGAVVRCITVNTDTSFGTSTIAIGTTASPAKYVTATTFTTPTDRPTVIGPKASVHDDAPLSAEEELWVTVAVATIASGTIAVFEIEYTIST